MDIDRTTGPSAALPLSLQLTVKSASDHNQAGISNLGYWGFPVRPKPPTTVRSTPRPAIPRSDP